MVQKEIRQVLSVCPMELQRIIATQPTQTLEQLEEIRLRNGQAVTLTVGGREVGLTVATKQAWIESILSSATGYAVYSAQELLKNGFVTLRGGHRVGICGTAVYQNGEVSTLKEISSLNLRIARQIHGIGARPADYLWTHPGSVLIIGPPGRGKTTLLRDLICELSDRFHYRIGIADERMELAACAGGQAQLDVGAHTDVLSGIRKAQATQMLLRTMNPQWIAVDEITAAEDIAAIVSASYCGVFFLATAHAATRAELKERPLYRQLLDTGFFENLFIIQPDRSVRLERMKQL